MMLTDSGSEGDPLLAPMSALLGTSVENIPRVIELLRLNTQDEARAEHMRSAP
jgi:hypothetical protein